MSPAITSFIKPEVSAAFESESCCLRQLVVGEHNVFRWRKIPHVEKMSKISGYFVRKILLLLVEAVQILIKDVGN